jgi:hypothetical protein
MPSATDDLERVKKWSDPEEWYGILDPFTGELWNVLTRDFREARAISESLEGGQIVVITTRIGCDEDGEYIAPRMKPTDFV